MNCTSMANPGQSTDVNPTHRNVQGNADVYAVFVVDASGIVVASNASGRRLWSVSNRSMVGLPFVAMFGFDRITAEPQLAAEEWQTLKTEAFERWTRRLAKPVDAPTREVRLQLERSIGGAGTYIVNVQTLDPA